MEKQKTATGREQTERIVSALIHYESCVKQFCQDGIGNVGDKLYHPLIEAIRWCWQTHKVRLTRKVYLDYLRQYEPSRENASGLEHLYNLCSMKPVSQDDFKPLLDTMTKTAGQEVIKDLLIDAAGDYKKGLPPEQILERFTRGGKALIGRQRARGIRLDRVEVKAVEWLWADRVPRGNLSIIFGNGGCGKSHISLGMIACVTSGKAFPDGQSPVKGGAILISGEDVLADTVVPRLIAAGADTSKVVTIGVVGEKVFTLHDLPILESHLEQFQDETGVSPVLVVIDPISSFLGKTDSYKDSEVRGLLTPLQKLAERYNVAIVIVAHVNKGRGLRATAKLSGSVAFNNASRSSFYCGEISPDSGRYAMTHAKCNCAKLQDSLSYRIEREFVRGIPTTKLVWDGVSDLTADDIARGEELPESKRDDCADWLKDTLSKGAVASDTIFAEGGKEGYSKSTIFRAKKDMGAAIKVSRRGYGADGIWVWSLNPGQGQAEQRTAKPIGDKGEDILDFSN